MTRRPFSSTQAVESARRRDRYIACPACGSRQQRYLFHRTGVRFVRCRACALVYADPVDPGERAYFDIGARGQHDDPVDLRNLLADFDATVATVRARYERYRGRAARRILLVGRWHREFAHRPLDGAELELAADLVSDEHELVTRPLAETLGDKLAQFDIVLFHEFLEATHEPIVVLEALSEHLHPDAMLAVAFSNMSSLPSRVLRRRWKSFFDEKIGYYNAGNLEMLLWRSGFRRLGQEALRTSYSLGYLADRLSVQGALRDTLRSSMLRGARVRGRSGHELMLFAPAEPAVEERLSIIVPVYNEERYVGEILDALLAHELQIDREIIVVESNSSDSSREIVARYEEKPGVTVIYEDQPRGKGHAVRAALAAARGSIVLIQDADFEYDLDDYDALLEPIIQRRTSFVLGSRSLGHDDWKIRQYASSPIKGFLMNFAQIVFAKTFNILYQQQVTDINTMLKVFRRECIEGLELTGNGFNFDIELVCKIVRNGYDPLEVPVNYVARSFEEGKKINFLLDAYPSYYQLFRCRVGPV